MFCPCYRHSLTWCQVWMLFEPKDQPMMECLQHWDRARSTFCRHLSAVRVEIFWDYLQSFYRAQNMTFQIEDYVLEFRFVFEIWSGLIYIIFGKGGNHYFTIKLTRRIKHHALASFYLLRINIPCSFTVISSHGLVLVKFHPIRWIQFKCLFERNCI